MMIRHLAGVSCWIAMVMTSAGVSAQQGGPSTAPGPTAQIVVVRTYPQGAALRSRRVETRSESNARELRTEVVETPDPDGTLRPFVETVTETVRTSPDVTHTKRDVFEFVAPGQRRLLQTIESSEEILPNGSSRSVESTSTQDVNGRLELTSRRMMQTKLVANDMKQIDIAVFQRGTDATLVESERIQRTERQMGPDWLRTESTRSVRDPNGRFEWIEGRRRDVRTIAPSQRLEEESIVRPDNRIELIQRVRRTTTVDGDGGGQTVEEIDEPNPVSPSEPMRMVRRSVETIRRLAAGRWQTTLQLFVLDVNGRWVLAAAEAGEQTER
jgi:hypothetical protein